ncbi:MAG TPA: glutamate 5-kinase [Chromatiaceae bacterium]|jgi:glutamate 5-kinase|nr:glutamate 5-kinase [Chromatiaceae bacterium]HIN83043.1 glutamate 5-kinase [Chromatiales bacterium]HIO14183.1 glutamate 5-kinase [Chromatiales bacterium]
MNSREKLAASKRWVVKIGSSLLTANGRGLDKAAIARWVAQIAALRNKGCDVVLVSSGAVAEGVSRLGWDSRPRALHELQAAAAIGQMGLVQVYEANFSQHDLHTAQILLTHDDLSNRRRYLNARSSLNTLLDLGVVPVVNENDTVATDEIRLGDNDTLAALVANLIEADALVILTDQDGLFTADPGRDPDATLIDEVEMHDSRLEAMAGDSRSGLGRGGMRTKIEAARLAARCGAATVIVGGRIDDVIGKLSSGENVGTLLAPTCEPVAARKQWLAAHLQEAGKVVLDSGAAKVLRDSGGSLLAVGVVAVQGQFQRGELVSCIDEQGRVVARGLINYDANETTQIMGLPSQKIESVLGYVDESELIHRDNLVLV